MQNSIAHEASPRPQHVPVPLFPAPHSLHFLRLANFGNPVILWAQSAQVLPLHQIPHTEFPVKNDMKPCDPVGQATEKADQREGKFHAKRFAARQVPATLCSCGNAIQRGKSLCNRECET
jgi:hypothetical protein